MNIKCKVQVISKKTIYEIPNAWTGKDYRSILLLLGYDQKVEFSEVEEMAINALANQEHEVSAALLLNYKLKGHLNQEQIQKLACKMQEVEISEEYLDIFIQHELFNINQLLHKVYQDHFHENNAIELILTLKLSQISYMQDEDLINEIILKALSPELGDHLAKVRINEDAFDSKNRIPLASGIFWKTEICKSMDGCFDIRLFSSQYWLDNVIPGLAYETTIEVIELQECS